MLFRVVLVRWSNPLLFYKTQGPQSLEMMEQTQNEHDHVAHPLRDSLDARQPLCPAVGCSLLHLPYYSLLSSAFILLLLPLVISAYVLTILLGFHVRQPENRFRWEEAAAAKDCSLTPCRLYWSSNYKVSRVPEMNLRALCTAFFEIKILAKNTKLFPQ